MTATTTIAPTTDAPNIERAAFGDAPHAWGAADPSAAAAWGEPAPAGAWIVTASGHELSLSDPRPGHIDLYAISHALAQCNRFAGHAARPYSVAEHSLLVLDIISRTERLPIEGLLAALLHDAHEAFIGDVSTPLKRLLGPEWAVFEAAWQDHVLRAMGCREAFAAYHDAIKRADLIALATERRDLISRAARTPWPSLEGIEPAGWVDLMDRGRVTATWRDWQSRFADAADSLDYARQCGIEAGGEGG